jgi:lipopolysaccharide heptosyltransferase II
MKKILIIQTASLGDVVLATPLIEKLHRFFPEARIDFLVKQGGEGLLRGHPYLKHVMVWDKSEKKYARLRELIVLIREQKYDLVVNAQRFASTGLLTVLSGAAVTTGFNKNPFSVFFTYRKPHVIRARKGSPHETERNLKLIEDFTDKSVFKPKLYPSPHDFAKVSQYKTRQFITISPGSLWFTKAWPEKKWADFARRTDSELLIYFLGAANEKAMIDRIIKASGHANSLNLAGKLTLLESAALMRDALMNYTNDSAPMHLASAMNAPVAAIFCSTVPEYGFGPLSDRSFVIQTTETLDCRPCGLHGKKSCPKRHFRCAESIETKQLLSCLTN